MTKVTLDTNLLIELFDLGIEGKTVPALGKIFNHCFDFQNIDLKITTKVSDDLLGDRIKERAQALKLRIDNLFSVLGAGYVSIDDLPSDPIEKLNFIELQRVLFPNLITTDKRYKNKINDVHHLHRHIRAGRDVFITNDSDMLKKKDALKTAFKVVVMSPEECAKYLDVITAKESYPFEKHVGRADYHSPALKGTVTFDFTNNDHKYTIGTDDWIFETRWSECSDDEMYAYNDAPSILALAVAENVSKFKDVHDFERYDSTSRVRQPRKNVDILVLKNSKGYFAAVKICNIELKRRGGNKNELTFEYVIQPNGTSSFKGL